MRQIEIEVTDDAIHEAKQIFKTNQDFICMLNRMGSSFKRNDRRFICRIACTDAEWWRYKDVITNTRSAFIIERSKGKEILVVLHVLPRTDITYEIFKWIWESCLQ